jgi:hypothetical protein
MKKVEELERLKGDLQVDIEAAQQSIADLMQKVAAADAEIDAVSKISVPRDVLVSIINSVQSSVEEAIQDISSCDVEVELSMGYNNQVEVDGIDLSNVDLDLEDFLMQEFEEVFNVIDGPIPGAYEIAK